MTVLSSHLAYSTASRTVIPGNGTLIDWLLGCETWVPWATSHRTHLTTLSDADGLDVIAMADYDLDTREDCLMSLQHQEPLPCDY